MRQRKDVTHKIRLALEQWGQKHLIQLSSSRRAGEVNIFCSGQLSLSESEFGEDTGMLAV
jgi:hypothetical protein